MFIFLLNYYFSLAKKKRFEPKFFINCPMWKHTGKICYYERWFIMHIYVNHIKLWQKEWTSINKKPKHIKWLWYETPITNYVLMNPPAIDWTRMLWFSTSIPQTPKKFHTWTHGGTQMHECKQRICNNETCN